jgi:V/A-type H+-transporting ATPase subunit A
MSNIVGKITKISGPLIVADGMRNVRMFDVVYVSDKKLIGEIIELRGDLASIQVYEETSGLRIGEPVFDSGAPLSVELAPGLIGGIFDGIGRPLESLRELTGERISRGASVDALNRQTKWRFKAVAKTGDEVHVGDILGTVQETPAVQHRILVPQGIAGKITQIKDGEFTIIDAIAKIGEEEVTMLRKWPVRKSRPYKTKMTPTAPLITGQRVIDTFFPVAKGGVAAIPGPFGSGKTVIQHQLAKWADADIVVYIGCGERGNEMTDVLNEFPRLLDAKNGQPLMKRTILIANTSDMPVAAREASVYTGITIAEYFRDQGYNVAIMADSTSRWAEALREMSGRLEEMPGEEGYPAYLSSRLAEFYERAGVVKVLGSEVQGSITAIGAVSPPGGDLSEPVAQATLRIVKVFWGLSASLAYKRHLPAIDWLISYSLYAEKMSDWYAKNLSPEFLTLRAAAIKLLQEDASLEEIVRLVGIDSLSDKEKLIMETARSVREDFLQQNAFSETDTYSSLKKQFKILKVIFDVHNATLASIDKGVNFYDLLKPAIKEKIARLKYLPEAQLDTIDALALEIGGSI